MPDKVKRRRSESSGRRETPNDGRRQFEWRTGERVMEYELVKELGKGAFAKVIQGRNRTKGTTVAMKFVHDIRRYHESALIEITMLRDIKSKDPTNSLGCAEIIEDFTFDRHRCIVFPKYGPSIFDVIVSNDYKGFPSNTVQAVSYHILSAMKQLHSLNIIHTDIKPENIVFRHPEMLRSSSKNHPLSSEIVIIDLGNAQYDDEPKEDVIQTKNYRAPEVMFGANWSMPVDIWSVGCLLVELVTGELLFSPTDTSEHIVLIEHICGSFSSHMCRRYKSFFDSKGRARRSSDPRLSSTLRKNPTLRNHCSSMPSGFRDLVRGLLERDPYERLTARRALDSEYLKCGSL